jgi:hypothetical protein
MYISHADTKKEECYNFSCFHKRETCISNGNNGCLSFPIHNYLKQGDALSPFLFDFALEYAIVGPAKQNGCVILCVGNLADERF